MTNNTLNNKYIYIDRIRTSKLNSTYICSTSTTTSRLDCAYSSPYYHTGPPDHARLAVLAVDDVTDNMLMVKIGEQ